MSNCRKRGLYVRPSRRVEVVETIGPASRGEGERLAWERVQELALIVERLGQSERFGYWYEYQGSGIWRITLTDRSISEDSNERRSGD